MAALQTGSLAKLWNSVSLQRKPSTTTTIEQTSCENGKKSIYLTKYKAEANATDVSTVTPVKAEVPSHETVQPFGSSKHTRRDGREQDGGRAGNPTDLKTTSIAEKLRRHPAFLEGQIVRSPTKTLKLQSLLQTAIYGGVYVATVESENKESASSKNSLYFGQKRRVAVKVMSLELNEKNKTRLQEDAYGELKFLHYMKGHKNILVAEEIFQIANLLYVILPYAEYEDLFETLKRRPKPFSESEARWLFWQLFHAAKYLHSKGIAFRDHSLENILLFHSMEDGTVYPKITDPGQAMFMEYDADGNVKLQACRATFGKSFRSPELYNNAYYDPRKVDSFCLGWILFYCITKNQPFEKAVDSDRHWMMIKNRDFVNLLKARGGTYVTPHARDLIFKMLLPDFKQRYSIEQAVNHAWFRIGPHVEIDDRTIYGLTHSADRLGPHPKQLRKMRRKAIHPAMGSSTNPPHKGGSGGEKVIFAGEPVEGRTFPVIGSEDKLAAHITRMTLAPASYLPLSNDKRKTEGGAIIALQSDGPLDGVETAKGEGSAHNKLKPLPASKKTSLDGLAKEKKPQHPLNSSPPRPYAVDEFSAPSKPLSSIFKTTSGGSSSPVKKLPSFKYSGEATGGPVPLPSSNTDTLTKMQPPSLYYGDTKRHEEGLQNGLRGIVARGGQNLSFLKSPSASYFSVNPFPEEKTAGSEQGNSKHKGKATSGDEVGIARGGDKVSITEKAVVHKNSLRGEICKPHKVSEENTFWTTSQRLLRAKKIYGTSSSVEEKRLEAASATSNASELPSPGALASEESKKINSIKNENSINGKHEGSREGQHLLPPAVETMRIPFEQRQSRFDSPTYSSLARATGRKVGNPSDFFADTHSSGSIKPSTQGSELTHKHKTHAIEGLRVLESSSTFACAFPLPKARRARPVLSSKAGKDEIFVCKDGFTMKRGNANIAHHQGGHSTSYKPPEKVSLSQKEKRWNEHALNAKVHSFCMMDPRSSFVPASIAPNQGGEKTNAFPYLYKPSINFITNANGVFKGPNPKEEPSAFNTTQNNPCPVNGTADYLSSSSTACLNANSNAGPSFPFQLRPELLSFPLAPNALPSQALPMSSIPQGYYPNGIFSYGNYPPLLPAPFLKESSLSTFGWMIPPTLGSETTGSTFFERYKQRTPVAASGGVSQATAAPTTAATLTQPLVAPPQPGMESPTFLCPGAAVTKETPFSTLIPFPLPPNGMRSTLGVDPSGTLFVWEPPFDTSTGVASTARRDFPTSSIPFLKSGAASMGNYLFTEPSMLRGERLPGFS